MSESAIADDIGRIGESFFDYQMTHTNLLVGKIDPDRVGKDRVIEAKLARRSDDVSFDKRPAPLACSLQIKTILRTTKVVKVSLSVAERLAHGLVPAFIYMIRLDEDHKPADVRMIHILGPALEKILKRLRKEYAEGATELHNKSINFQFKDGKSIGLLGADLANYLESEIGPDMDVYAQRKSAQKKNLGYKNGQRTKISGSIAAAPIGEVIDGLLGLRPLSIASMEAMDERFGIALPDPRFPKFLSGTTAEFKPKPMADCVLVIGPSGNEEAVEIECEAILPALPSLPVQFFKAILRSPILDATITINACTISTRPVGPGDARTLSDWISLFTILVGFSSKDGVPISLRSPRGSEKLGLATNDSAAPDVNDAYTLRLLKALRAIRIEAGTSDIPLTLDDVYASRQSIFSAHSCIEGQFRDDVSFTTAPPASDTLPDEIQLLIINGFELGEEHFIYTVSCSMQTAIKDGRAHFSQNGKIAHLEVQVLSDFGPALDAYQRRMMRITGSDACVTYLAQKEEGPAGTSIQSGTDDTQIEYGTS